jgi:hypothetical protein
MDSQHYGIVSFHCNPLFAIPTVLQYEESDADFPAGELSAVQQQIFEGF